MRRRSGFTLPELLVAMALILLIMSILSAAFVAASGSVSDLKAAGDLAEKLRTVTNVLHHDLEADHFDDWPSSAPGTGPRLSDANFWDRIAPFNPIPPAGFFRIYQGSQAQPLPQPLAPLQTIPVGPPGANYFEGYDSDGMPSYLSVNHALHYTVALRGTYGAAPTRRSEFLSALVPNTVPAGATVPPGAPNPLLSATDPLLGSPDQRYQDTVGASFSAYNTAFAEIAVFLAPNGEFTDNTQTVPLYTLYRRQFLAVPSGWTPATPVPATDALNYLEVSAASNAGPNMAFNSMQTLTLPTNRFGMDRGNLSGVYQVPPARYPTMGEQNAAVNSADLLLNDVVSFDVRVLLQGGSGFVDLYDPTVQAFSGNNPAFSLPNGPRVFDTWTNQGAYLTSTYAPGLPTSVPLYQSGFQKISIQAIQITIRAWDFKTKKTRQVTMVQQM